MGRRAVLALLVIRTTAALAPPPRLRRLRRARRPAPLIRRATNGDDGETSDAKSNWLAAITGDEELAEDLRVYGKTLAICLAIRFLLVEPRFIPSLSMYPGLDVGDQLAVEKVTMKARPRDAPFRRNEVVVFNPPQSFKDIVNSRARNEALIKRVVAVAGESVEVKGGALYVNGVAQSEAFINEQPAYTMARMVVPAGHIFVLGVDLCGNQPVGYPESHCGDLREALRRRADVVTGTTSDGVERHAAEQMRLRRQRRLQFHCHAGDNRNQSLDGHVWGFLPTKNVIGRAVFKYWPPSRAGPIQFPEGSY